MSYFVRLNFLFGIILFSFLIKASAAQTSYDSELTPSLKRVLINGDSVIYTSDNHLLNSKDLKKNIVLSYRNNHITFELQPADSTNYQFYLEGFDKEWSSWKQINFKEYTNLHAGKYTFKIRYISSGNSGGEISLISLRVLPMWYFSKVAILIYLILFLSINIVTSFMSCLILATFFSSSSIHCLLSSSPYIS